MRAVCVRMTANDVAGTLKVCGVEGTMELVGELVVSLGKSFPRHGQTQLHVLVGACFALTCRCIAGTAACCCMCMLMVTGEALLRV